MKKLRTNAKRIITKAALLMTGVYLLFVKYSMQVCAKSESEAVEILKETDLYKGSMAAIGAGTTIAIVLIDSAAALFVVIEGFKYMNAEEEIKAKHKKRIITIVLVAAGLTTAKVLIPAIISIFQG